MAEGILFDLAGRLIEDLGSRLFQEIGLAAEVREEIGKLEETMRSIKAVLLDAEERQGKKNHQVTEWLRRLKEVVYDADDLLDDFATELQLREDVARNRMAKEVCICFSKSNKLAYGLKMGHKIKAIREKIDAIQSNRGFHLDENPVQNVGREQTHSYVHADDIIGRDDDKNAIIQRLLNSDNVGNVSVIPMVGIGGLGKTTLTKLIYNDEKIKTNFQLRMWVCVADVFDVRIIVQNIIKSANDKDVERLEKLNMDQLQKRLNEEITGKKYLLVLDDIWNENRESWIKLEMLLMNGMKGSQILITTRSKRVAEISSTLPFHELRGLSEDQSWSLFTKMAFEHGREPEGSNLVEIGKSIVKKCIGVPLAIRTIGRFLYHNYSKDYWMHFKEHELSQILDQEEGDILPTLKLSYDNLPSHLKQCFAYCALFPNDYIIKKEYLVDLWMAQGFLKSSNMNYRSQEGIGNDYFMSLLSRSFFQDVEYDDGGNVIYCKMHDLMHDLATQVAGSECTLLKLDATNYGAKARHISFDSVLDFSWKIPKALLENNLTRTFLLPIRSYVSMFLNKSNLNKIILSFTYLRTLDLIGSNIKKLSNSIGKLKHLRYLDISYNEKIVKIPNSMSRLKNLQILKLQYCGRLKELPRDMRKMVSLRCLMVNGCGSLNGMPRGLGSLANLQRLSTFVLGSKSEKYAELCELDGLLTNLSGELQIRGLRKVRSKHSLLANLKAQKNLKHLTLDWGPGFSKSDGASIIVDEVLECLQPHHSLKALHIHLFVGLRISSWLSSLTNLTSIWISNCQQCRHIPRLDQLPSLKSLALTRLYDLEYVSELDSSSTSFFPSLKELCIWNCRNLKGWWKDVNNDDGAMELPSFPCLSKLQIIDCPNLTCMLLYPSLEELFLDKASLRPLKQTMMLMNVATPSISSTVSTPFSKLKSLIISGCDSIDFLTNVDDKKWKGFTSLNSITFSRSRELVSFPQGIQHVPNLQNLSVWSCLELKDLPGGMMQLQVLRIDNCPQLSKRCGNNMGVDWPKVSHIPNIEIDRKWIQKEGCYQLKTKGEGEGAGSSSA